MIFFLLSLIPKKMMEERKWERKLGERERERERRRKGKTRGGKRKENDLLDGSRKVGGKRQERRFYS